MTVNGLAQEKNMTRAYGIFVCLVFRWY